MLHSHSCEQPTMLAWNLVLFQEALSVIAKYLLKSIDQPTGQNLDKTKSVKLFNRCF